MARLSRELTIVLKAKDATKAVFRQVGTSIKRIRSITSSVGGVFSKVFGGFASLLTLPFRLIGGIISRITRLQTLLVAGLGVAIIKTFGEFREGIAQVSTLVDTSVVDMEKLADGVRRIGRETGESFGSLNKALFDAISAGVDAAKSVGFLEVATKLAGGGATTVADATRGLVSILNAYGESADFAGTASDSLFQAMKGGVTTVEALSNNLGKIAPIARAAGLEVDELTGGTAALTKVGLSTEEAATAYRAFLVGIIQSTDDAKAAAKEYNFELSAQALETKGLVKFVQELSEATDNNVTKMSRLFPNVRAVVGALAFAKDGARDLAAIMESMADKAGATDEAFEKTDTIMRTIRKTIRAVENAFISLGAIAAPVVERIAKGIQAFADSIVGHESEIRIVLETIAFTVGDIARIFTSSFSEGKLGQTLVTTLKFIGSSFKDVLVEVTPLVFEGGRQLGKLFGAAFIDLFIEQTKVGAARFLNEQVQQAAKAGGNIAENLEAMAVALPFVAKGGIEGARRVQELAEELRIAERVLEGLLEAPAVFVTDKDIQDQRKRIDDLKKLIGGEGSNLDAALSEAVFVMRTKGAEAAKALAQKMDENLETAKDRLPDTAKGIVDGIIARFNELPGRLRASRDRDARAAFADFFVEGARKGLDEAAPRLQVIADQFVKVFRAATQGLDSPSAPSPLGGLTPEQLQAHVESVQFLQEQITILSKTGADRQEAILRASLERQLSDLKANLADTKEARELLQRFRLLSEEEISEKIRQLRTRDLSEFQQQIESFVREGIPNLLASGFADAFTDVVTGAKSAKEAFADFARSVIADLIRITTQILILGALKSIFGGIFLFGDGSENVEGGITAGGGGRGPMRFQRGGIVRRPTIGIVGEGRLDEAIVPLPDGRSIPVEFRGRGGTGEAGFAGGGETNVSITIMAMDSRDVSRVLMENSETVRDIIETAISSDGGFAKTVGQRSRKGFGR